MFETSIIRILSKTDKETTIGTGFFISNDGYLITCYHVVRDACPSVPRDQEELEIEDHAGNRWIGRFQNILSNVLEDIAVLKVDSTGFKCVSLGFNWESADRIQIYGFQYSEFKPFPEVGILSGQTSIDGKERLVIKDARHIFQGASGAPAINVNTQRVIGVLSEKWMDQDAETVFVIPLRKIVTQWSELERVQHEIEILSTDSHTSSEILSRLRQNIQDGKCLAILGPNISISSYQQPGSSSEWQIAAELASLCKYEDENVSLPTVAQFYMQQHGRDNLLNFLRTKFLNLFNPLIAHYLVARLPFPLIYYLSYDNLIEQALGFSNVMYSELMPGAILEKNGDVKVIKLIGSIHHSSNDTVIITTDDYEKWPEIIAPSLEMSKSFDITDFLFIGFNLEDSRLQTLFNQLCKIHDPEKVGYYAIQSNVTHFSADYWDDLGVQIINSDQTQFLLSLTNITSYKTVPQITIDEENVERRALTRTDLKELTSKLDKLLERMGVPSLIESLGDFSLSETQLINIRDMRMEVELMKSGMGSSIPNESPEYLVKIGNIELASGNIEQAADLYRRALELEHSNPEAHYNLHYILLEKENFKIATHEYLTAISLKPDYSSVPSGYEVNYILGKGGMGVVYKAGHKTINQQVAIKVLKRSLSRNYRAIDRFKREAILTKRLQHPNIVKIIDTGTHRGKFYIIYEYLEGRDLKMELAEHKITPKESFDIIIAVCNAMKHAHKVGIVHRDIKPSNIFLSSDGVKVIDFGLAQHISSSQLTTVGFATGTLSYMSPEQKYGFGQESYDPRSDIYSIGATFYEMLTGKLPEGNFKNPSELNPQVEKTVDLIVSKAIAYDLHDRYSSLEELIASLNLVVYAPPNMVLVPAGEFTMGDNRFEDEVPQHVQYLPSYYIDKFPVTNQEYERINSEHKYPPHKANHPVVGISWDHAKEYAKAVGKRLPTEAEWEKAARGTDLREYPWGNEFDINKSNMAEMGVGDTLPVGYIPANISPYGCLDMAGNVWEWTSDWYDAYPGSSIRDKNYGKKFVAIRGGSFRYSHFRSVHLPSRSADRFQYDSAGDIDIGFRCVVSAPIE